MLTDVDTGESGLYDICGIDLVVPEVEKPSKLILTCRLDFEDGSVVDNNWEIWAFPKEEKAPALDAAVDMREDYLSSAFTFDQSSPLTVTDKLDDSLFERLERGEDVILVYRTDWTRHLLHKGMDAPEYALRATWDRFKGVIWDRGTINGGPDDKETLTKHGFVTDGQINYQYYDLIDDSDKINLDDFPVKVHSLVSCLDKCNRDRFDPKKFALPELMYDRTMRKFSYVFSLRVGKGRLLVCGFNLTGAAEGKPATVSMVKTLVNYCRTDASFGDGEGISVEALKDYLRKTALRGPQKERMMTQYWQLDAEPVESSEYWTESERYLREDLIED